MNPDITLPKTAKVQRYVALLTQTGTNAPTATVLQNTMGGTVTWTREGEGLYMATLDEIFDETKTVSIVGNNLDLDTLYVSAYIYNATNTVGVTTLSSGVNADGLLNKTPIIIEIYNL